MKSVVNGVTTYYVGGYYELVVEGLNETERKYYAAGGTTIAMRENGTLYWLLERSGIRCANSLNICEANVHLGSTSMTATANGEIFSEVRYSAFGEVRFSTNSTPTDYLYTGHRMTRCRLWLASIHPDHIDSAASRNMTRLITLASTCRPMLRRRSFFHQTTYPRADPSRNTVGKPNHCQA